MIVPENIPKVSENYEDNNNINININSNSNNNNNNNNNSDNNTNNYNNDNNKCNSDQISQRIPIRRKNKENDRTYVEKNDPSNINCQTSLTPRTNNFKGFIEEEVPINSPFINNNNKYCNKLNLNGSYLKFKHGDNS